MLQINNFKANHLLAALSDTEWQRIRPYLEPVELQLGQVLYESGRPIDYAYFPTTAIVSVLYVMESGASAEIAVIGREGVVGVSLFLGGDTTPSRGVVRSAGLGIRLNAQRIKNEFNLSGPFMCLMLRYT